MRSPDNPTPGATLTSFFSRVETVIVVVLVVALAVSAILMGPHEPTQPLVLAIADNIPQVDPVEMLTAHLHSVTGRDIVTVGSGSTLPDDCELVLLAAADYVAGDGRSLPVVGVVSRPPGAALIASRGVERDDVRAADVVCSSDGPVNGGWIQLSELADGEGLVPRSVPSAERVVVEVTLGRARAGAVPHGIVESMVSRRILSRGEVSTLRVMPGLPEYLLCACDPEVERIVETVVGGPVSPLRDDDLERLRAVRATADRNGWVRDDRP